MSGEPDLKSAVSRYWDALPNERRAQLFTLANGDIGRLEIAVAGAMIAVAGAMIADRDGRMSKSNPTTHEADFETLRNSLKSSSAPANGSAETRDAAWKFPWQSDKKKKKDCDGEDTRNSRTSSLQGSIEIAPVASAAAIAPETAPANANKSRLSGYPNHGKSSNRQKTIINQTPLYSPHAPRHYIQEKIVRASPNELASAKSTTSAPAASDGNDFLHLLTPAYIHDAQSIQTRYSSAPNDALRQWQLMGDDGDQQQTMLRVLQRVYNGNSNNTLLSARPHETIDLPQMGMEYYRPPTNGATTDSIHSISFRTAFGPVGWQIGSRKVCVVAATPVADSDRISGQHLLHDNQEGVPIVAVLPIPYKNGGDYLAAQLVVSPDGRGFENRIYMVEIPTECGSVLYAFLFDPKGRLSFVVGFGSDIDSPAKPHNIIHTPAAELKPVGVSNAHLNQLRDAGHALVDTSNFTDSNATVNIPRHMDDLKQVQANWFTRLWKRAKERTSHIHGFGGKITILEPLDIFMRTPTGKMFEPVIQEALNMAYGDEDTESVNIDSFSLYSVKSITSSEQTQHGVQAILKLNTTEAPGYSIIKLHFNSDLRLDKLLNKGQVEAGAFDWNIMKENVRREDILRVLSGSIRFNLSKGASGVDYDSNGHAWIAGTTHFSGKKGAGSDKSSHVILVQIRRSRSIGSLPTISEVAVIAKTLHRDQEEYD